MRGSDIPPLRMVLYGEGGTGKSRVIQTITEAFATRGVSHMLIKAAYTGDQLPISAVLGSAPIPYRVYSAPTFGIPDRSAIGRLLHVSRLPGSPDYFSIFPAVYPTSCRPSTATWLNDPRLSSSGSRSTVYRLLSPFDPVLQRLWRQPIIATRDFLFRIDRFPRPPRLATRVVKSTFLFRSRLLLPD